MSGFSVMAAKLYEHRHVTLGALLAVFIATSDEGLLVLLLSSEAGFVWTSRLYTVLGLLGAKLALGIGLGYAADLVLRKNRVPAPIPAPHEHDHEHDREHEEHEEDHEHGDCACDELSVCEHKHPSTLRLYLVSPLLHTLEVAAFVLVVNLAFGFLFFGVGEARVVGFLQGAGYWFQPLVCPLIGLVPNCASSVVLAEVYCLGGIGFGGLLGGLVTNAGLGYLVLFGKGKSTLRAVGIMLAMYLIGVAAGYAASGIALAVPL